MNEKIWLRFKSLKGAECLETIDVKEFYSITISKEEEKI